VVVAAEWTDLVDPTGDEIAQAITPPPPPAAIELLTSPAGDGRAAVPVLQGHGHCVLAVLAQPVSVPGRDRADYLHRQAEAQFSVDEGELVEAVRRVLARYSA